MLERTAPTGHLPPKERPLQTWVGKSIRAVPVKNLPLPWDKTRESGRVPIARSVAFSVAFCTRTTHTPE